MVRTPARPTGRRRALAAALLSALCLAGLAVAPAARAAVSVAQGASPAAHGAGRATYTNPVSQGFADTFADPAVIRARDGFWYAYGTTDPLREGERTRHIIPTARSRDLVHWTYVDDAFTESTLPSWAAPGAALWAPDIRYLDGTWAASASSRDGRHWTWGGVWTLAAGTRSRIGLISHGGAGAVAEFDYVRIYQP